MNQPYKAIEIYHFNPLSWFCKGLAEEGLKKYNEALECYDRALKFNPHFVIAIEKKGILLRFLHKNEEALKCFDKALKLNPETSVPLSQIPAKAKQA